MEDVGSRHTLEAELGRGEFDRHGGSIILVEGDGTCLVVGCSVGGWAIVGVVC
jgi:hypothetical protein